MEMNSGWKSCFRSIGLCPKMHSAAQGADMKIVNSQMLGFGSISKKSRILELTVSPLGGAGIWPMIKGASTTSPPHTMSHPSYPTVHLICHHHKCVCSALAVSSLQAKSPGGWLTKHPWEQRDNRCWCKEEKLQGRVVVGVSFHAVSLQYFPIFLTDFKQISWMTQWHTIRLKMGRQIPMMRALISVQHSALI